MNVRKRSGKVVPFDAEFIRRAVTLAAAAAGEHEPGRVDDVTDAVEGKLAATGQEIMDIERIQDAVEETLFEKQLYRTAKTYILYRVQKEKERTSGEWKEGILTREFLSPYKHAPNPMEQLGAFVYTRTYSRYLPQQGRREFWWETVRRAVEYNASLAPTSREEAEKLYDNIYHLRQFLSGRTLWVGGTPVAEKYPMANYNCAFTVINDFTAYHDLFYLLMVGSGVGVRVLNSDADQLPPVRADLKILHKSYDPVPAGERLEYTNLTFQRDTATLTIGDSKEGFMERDAQTGDAGVQKTERIITDRVSSQSVARAQAHLTGLETVHEWTYDTPDGHTLVGVVKAYRFSGIERAREILEGPQEEPQAEEAAQEPTREFQNSNRRGSVESSLDVF